MGVSTFTFSKAGSLRQAVGTDQTTSTIALADLGSGVFADSATQPVSAPSSGLYVFLIDEATGLDLHFALTAAAAGKTALGRVCRAIPVVNSEGDFSQYTFRHLCDITLTSSAQTGVGSSAVVKTTRRWASVTVTSDAGLAPLGSRSTNGTTSNAGGSLWLDPMCGPLVVVQLKVVDCDDIEPFAMDWTSS